MQQKSVMKDIPMLPLRSDIVFKRVFSKEGNEKILKDLLEAILEIKIQKVVVKNPELPRNLTDSKAGVLDIKVEIDKDTICDVEMQVKDRGNIDKRSTFYLAKLLSDEIKKGQDYIKVKKTIVINILNFNYYKRNSYHSIAHMKFEKTKPEKYINMEYSEEEEIATEDIEMHFIEIPKFIKKKPEMKNKLEQWLWLIVGEKEEIEMAKKENKEIEKAMEIIKEMSMDPKEWEMYESRRLAIMDYNTGIHNAKEEGIEQGRKEGKKEGMEEGRKEGKIEGQKEEKLEIAKKLLKKKASIKEIIEITELTEEEIIELKNKMQ